MKGKRTLDVIGILMLGVILVCGFLSPTSTEAATFYVRPLVVIQTLAPRRSHSKPSIRALRFLSR